MELYIKLELDQERYYSTGAAKEFSNILYRGGELLRLESFSINMSLYGGFEPSTATLVFADPSGDLRLIADSNPISKNSAIIYRESAGTLVKMVEMFIDQWGFTGGDTQEFYINISTRDSVIDENMLLLLNLDDFPNVVDNNVGKVVPLVIGWLTYGTVGVFDIPRVEATGTSSKAYLASELLKIPAIGTAGSPLTVYDAGVDVTSSITYTNVTESRLIRGTLTDFYRTYISYSGAADTLQVEWTGVNRPPSEFIVMAFGSMPEYSFTAASGVDDLLEKRLYWDSNYLANYPENYRFMRAYTEKTTATDVLNDLFESALLYSRFTADAEIELFMLDYEALTPVANYRESDFIIFDFNRDGGELETAGSVRYQPLNIDDTYQNDEFPQLDKSKGQSDKGYFVKDHDINLLISRDHARITSKHHAIVNSVMKGIVSFRALIDNFGADRLAGDIITATHPDGQTTGLRHYVIRYISFEHDAGTVSGELWDIEHLNLLDINAFLVIHAWIVGSEEVYNDAPNHEAVISNVGNVVTGTHAVNVNGGMLDFDGTNHLLVYDIYDFLNPNWSITEFTNYSISFFFSVTSTATDQVLLSYFQDTGNRWEIRFVTGLKTIKFLFRDSAVSQIDISGVTNAVNDTNRHHVYIVKVGSVYAVYVDGVQGSYANHTGTYNYAGDLYFGQRGNNTLYLTGAMEEIRVGKDNVLCAAPNVGLTDTLSAPILGFNWNGLITV